MSYYPRIRWGARRAPAGIKLVKGEVRGVALHWPGDDVRRTTPDQVKAALRAWQAYHMDVKDWRDIAYSVAVDQAGNVYSLRGLRYRSGANGDETLNRRYVAILLVVAEGETPSPALIKETRRLVGNVRRIFPGADAVVGHGDIRPGGTDCPGKGVRAALRAGKFG